MAEFAISTLDFEMAIDIMPLHTIRLLELCVFKEMQNTISTGTKHPPERGWTRL